MIKKRPRTPRRVEPLNTKCPFCTKGIEPDYKDYKILEKFLSERARIYSSLRSGVCAKHQRRLSREVKRARYLALLPFVPRIN